MTLAEQVLMACETRNLRLATAESCTGGLVSAKLTEIAGSSAVVDRGFVCYSNQAKIDMLGVSMNSLEAFGAVSEEVAREMARGALSRSEARIAISVTGIAGPGGSDVKPEGRVCFACATATGDIRSSTSDFGVIGRVAVREAACTRAFETIIEALDGRS